MSSDVVRRCATVEAGDKHWIVSEGSECDEHHQNERGSQRSNYAEQTEMTTVSGDGKASTSAAARLQHISADAATASMRRQVVATAWAAASSAVSVSSF
jgi:hypothetical protein